MNDARQNGAHICYTYDALKRLTTASTSAWNQSAGMGRFLSVDRGIAEYGIPSSWNRYTYALGDPSGRTDRKGLFADGEGCIDNPDLCPMDDSGSDGCSVDGTLGFGSGDGPPSCNPPIVNQPEVACWTNIDYIDQTLNDLGQNVEVLSQQSNCFSSGELLNLNSDMTKDISIEENSIQSDLASTSTFPNQLTNDGYYVGGHFNLVLDVPGIKVALSSDLLSFQALFGNTREPAVTGYNASGYTLHSGLVEKSGIYHFHFDTFNPLYDLAGLLGHFAWDGVGGHIGHPCLDPAWN